LHFAVCIGVLCCCHDPLLLLLLLLHFAQVNKNVYLKGRLGADGVAFMAAFKSWFQPSLTLAGVVEHCFDTGKTRSGLTVQVRSMLVYTHVGLLCTQLRGCIATAQSRADSCSHAGFPCCSV
jgi:hypothetical protein